MAKRDIYRNGKFAGREFSTRNRDGSRTVTRYRGSRDPIFGLKCLYGEGTKTYYAPWRKD